MKGRQTGSLFISTSLSVMEAAADEKRTSIKPKRMNFFGGWMRNKQLKRRTQGTIRGRYFETELNQACPNDFFGW